MLALEWTAAARRLMDAIEETQINNIRKASEVMGLDRVYRMQDLPPRFSSRQETPPFRPRLVLFISHRWETQECPDPTGRQLEAVKQRQATSTVRTGGTAAAD